MNWDQAAGNWKQFKGKVKEQWGKLTGDDLDVIAGHREQMVGKIQERYGVAKDEAEKQLTEWQGRVLKLLSGTMMVTLGAVLALSPSLLSNFFAMVALASTIPLPDARIDDNNVGQGRFRVPRNGRYA